MVDKKHTLKTKEALRILLVWTSGILFGVSIGLNYKDLSHDDYSSLYIYPSSCTDKGCADE